MSEVDVLVFEAGEARYGIRTTSVREIIRSVSIVPLPNTPAVIEGVINVRGEILPVLDIRRRFGLTPRSAIHTDHMIIAEAGTRNAVFRADRATELISVSERMIRDAASITRSTEYVAGVAALPDGLLLIHDPESFLTAAESAELDAALRQDEPPRMAT